MEIITLIPLQVLHKEGKTLIRWHLIRIEEPALRKIHQKINLVRTQCFCNTYKAKQFRTVLTAIF